MRTPSVFSSFFLRNEETGMRQNMRRGPGGHDDGEVQYEGGYGDDENPN